MFSFLSWLFHFLLHDQYTDDLARNKFLPLAAAAYSQNPQDCLDSKFEDAVMSSRQDVRCDPLATDSCAGFTAVLHSDKAIVLSFRGTNRFLQLLVEADETVFYRKVRWSPGGHVSKYFYDAFLSVWYGGMMKEFILLRKHYPSYDVWVTGHSLGASMASLAASHIISSRYIDGNYVRLITFGQPRTGDRPFADAHDKQMYYSYRVIHGRDVVPHLPPLNLEGYYHHDSEVSVPASKSALISHKANSSRYLSS
ncbi:unnamed protein product [Heligmosomoides polygyrus]|uniref:Lipase_3 domain-containing protein n=1 Tax=Heligmosomoides polygyrus TaxID=6339 RepID=A0A183FQY4_HELPZ|nr:unnamed protein product [Heligmosomoides polygyrus]